MKRIISISLAVMMLMSLLGCTPLILLATGAKQKEDAASSKTETKTEQSVTKPTEKPTAEPTDEPAAEPVEEPGEEPPAEISYYVSDAYDFYVEINSPNWNGAEQSSGICFTSSDDPYGTTQLVLYSIEAPVDSISLDDMVDSVVGSWKEAYGEDGVKTESDVVEVDVNGNNGRMQDASINYLGFELKGRVVHWTAGTRLYLAQLIGVESGFVEGKPILQGMLETFETAQAYHSRMGEA